jgi:quercetin dioxygenase-like cupin family protein
MTPSGKARDPEPPLQRAGGPDGRVRPPIVLPPGGGRRYAMGAIESVFKADEGETGERFSVSEWWLDARTKGPGAHAHEENDEIFYVLEGTCRFLVGEDWVEAPAGSFLMIPAGTAHDVENRSDARTGVLNVFIPGGFERNMPAIARWFREQGEEGGARP